MDRPLARSWWKRSTVVITGAIAGCGILAISLLSLGNTGSTLRMPLDRATLKAVDHGTFDDFIPVRGKVVPKDTIYVNAREGGSVATVHVQAGDFVKEGQPLVALNNPDLEHEVMMGEVSLVEQINNLRDAETHLEETHITNHQQLADIDYNLLRLTRQAERQKYYFSKGITSAEERDKAVDELDHYSKLRAVTDERNRRQEALRAARLPELQSALLQAQRNLTQTRAKLDQLTVRAPASGHLNSLTDLKVGQNLKRGEHIGDVTLDTGFKLSADIDEYYLGRIRPGQKAQMQIDGDAASLSVARVYPQVDKGRFVVDFDFDKSAPAQLFSGQALQGKLVLGKAQPALLLPAGNFLEVTGGDWVFVLDKDGRSAHRRRIKLGRRTTENLEVLDGLRAGEKVLVSDYQGFERIEQIVFTR